MDATTTRRLLEAERERLLRARVAISRDQLDQESEEESFGELAALDQHQADVGTEAFEREKELSILTQVEDDLREVEDALRRLASGSYGRCQTCGAPIGDERLEAVPAARFCDEHQRLWELSRITLSMPSGDGVALAGPATGRKPGGGRHDLSFLPTDDDVDEDIALSAEEAAMHDERSHLDAAGLELVEAREAAAAEREHDTEDAAEYEHLADVLVAEEEDEQLGR